MLLQYDAGLKKIVTPLDPQKVITSVRAVVPTGKIEVSSNGIVTVDVPDLPTQTAVIAAITTATS